jgi:hypothetical protein
LLSIVGSFNFIKIRKNLILWYDKKKNGRGNLSMNVHELESLFLQKRQYNCENANELIDFAKKAYIHNEISINEYRKLMRDLDALGAKIPQEPSSINEE